MAANSVRGALVSALVASALLVGGLPARAADTPAAQPVSVLVVDIQRVKQDSKVGKAIQGQMQQHLAAYQKSISAQEQELVTAQQDLQRQQSILAQDAFSVKVKEYEQRVGDARRKAQDSQREIAKGENDAWYTVDNTIRQILTDVVRERSANLVLPSAAVLLFDNKFDVTDDVIKRLDERLPTVGVTIGGGGAAPATAAKPAATPKKK